MLAQDMRRLAEEIADAYEERVKSISGIKAETAEKLAGFRRDLEDSNKERAERVQAELKEMGDSLRSDLNTFRSGLAQFKSDLDKGERGRKAEAQEEISERAQHIANLRKDTLNLVNDFENARKEMWRNLKSDLEDFTSGLTNFRSDLAGAHKERVEAIRFELKEMGDRLRSDLKDFMSLLAQFKADLDKAESARKEEALAEIAERRRDVDAVVGSTRDLLKEFGAARQEMWSTLKSQLETFTSEVSQFKADLEEGEKVRKDESLVEISQRRKEIANLNTEGLLREFRTARQEMWRNLKSELEAFTSQLTQFKADLDQAETERQETVGRDLKEKAEELRATLTGFSSDLSASVSGVMGELNKDRAEAARAWNQILSTMRTSPGETVVAPPVEAKPVVKPKTVPVVVKEKVKTPPVKVVAEKEIKPEPAAATKVEAEPEDAIEEVLDEREGLISEILGLLEDTPDGLRMVEIADILGVENWRSLIPIIRELLDDGDITKEGSTYYIA